MAVAVWGNLAKSGVDPEKIEEAIDRIVQEHNDDPDAHLGVGQSLESHKAADIIDHLAASIVTDKIHDKSVTYEKLSENLYVFRAAFESLDSWTVSASDPGAIVALSGGIVQIRAGDAIGDISEIALYFASMSLATDKDPRFQIAAIFPDADLNYNAGLMCGYSTPFGDPYPAFGFLVDGPTGKLYSYYNDGDGAIKHEITGTDLYSWHSYGASFVHSDHTLNFYIDSVLVDSVIASELVIDANDIFSAGAKAIAENTGVDMYVSNFQTAQNW